MSSTASAHPHSRFASVGLTERDLEPVQFLIGQTQVSQGGQIIYQQLSESFQLYVACITWINAFTQFKYQRRKHGLPENKANAYVYGTVLGQLKTAGKALAANLLQGKLQGLELPISFDNFEACVKELQCDDAHLDMGLLKPEKNLDHIAALFSDLPEIESRERAHPTPA